MQGATFLSEEDIVYLTGYTRPSKQREQLDQLHIPYYTDKAGYPRVLRSHLDMQQPPPTTVQPNLEAVNRLLGREA